MKELEYPFDSGYLLKKKRSIKRQLLSDGTLWTEEHATESITNLELDEICK